jgi:Cell wall-associated hydrolases (invasion-associated proteins)
MTEFIKAAQQLESAQQAAKNAKAAIITLQARLNGQRTVLVKTIDQQKKLLAQLTPVQQAPIGPGGGNGGGGGTPPPVYKGPTGTQAEKVVAFVYAQIGKPYVFGASGPNSYDCSGLTSAAWASVGISIPRHQRGAVGGPAARAHVGHAARRYPGLQRRRARRHLRRRRHDARRPRTPA